MGNNRTFFKNAKDNKMTLRDIFSEVGRKHTAEERDSVFIAGTELTTPKEADMLSSWVKPFMFARFFIYCLLGCVALYFLWTALDYAGGVYLLVAGIPFILPITLLILVWEMHIPRNISLLEVIKIVAAGGILSIFIAMIGFRGTADMAAMWAGIIEEPAKLLVIYFVLKRKNYVYILDGILIGTAVGTGFAAFESLIYSMNGFILSDSYGLLVALIRAFTAIAGHGIWAGLVGGALVMAKGTEEVEIRHLFKLDFLKYFALAILLHAYHNMGINVGLPVFFGGLLSTERIIETVIVVVIFLGFLRTGVSEIVTICANLNGGRVTRAVERNQAPNGAVHEAAPSNQCMLEEIAGPSVGQIFYVKEGKTVTIGRASGKNDIALTTCSNVSSCHCIVEMRQNRVYVTDLDSTNGTFIGEQRLQPRQAMPLADGQILYLGNTNCGFKVRIR